MPILIQIRVPALSGSSTNKNVQKLEALKISSNRLSFLLFFLVLAGSAVSAQTYTTLYNFSTPAQGVNLGAASVSLQDADGNFYGTATGVFAPLGGCVTEGGCGTIFKITSGGVLTTLVNFDQTTAAYPDPVLVRDGQGNFYGTTALGGTGMGCDEDGPCGTVFELNAGGNLTVVYNFTSPGPGYPSAGLVLGNDGDFYGTAGIASTLPNQGGGTIYKITPSGALTTLYTFPSGADTPSLGGPLVQGVDGNFYGTTTNTFYPYQGTFFQITPAGVLTTLYSFCASGPPCNDGEGPNALIQGTDGNLYGTTQGSGVNNGGTVFRVTVSGQLTTLYSFCSQPNCADGANPRAGLVQGSDGNFYGTTYSGGTGGACGPLQSQGECGTIFEITPSGQLTTLYNFCSQPKCSDGSQPIAGLLQAADKVFYGTTTLNGANNDGTFFSLSNGLSGSVVSITSLSLVPSSVTAGASGTLAVTAIVSPSSGSGTPTGTMAFSNGSTYIGTAPLVAGAATLNYDASALAVGAYQMTASYSGDGTYAVSTSSPQTLTVNPEPPADYQFSASSTSLSVLAGQTASAMLSVTPENGFNTPVTFSCSGLPTGVTCSFNPASVTASGNRPATSTLTISTTSESSALRKSERHWLGWICAFLMPGMGMFFRGIGRSERLSRSLSVLGIWSVLLWAMALSSCGSSPRSQIPPTTVPPTVATISVSATTGGVAAITHSVTLKVTITQ